jgi:hypothetical protein
MPTMITRGAFAASLLALALLVAASFAPVLDNGFLGLDDPAYITANPHVREGLTLGGVRWAATTFEAANWHPLTWISHMTDVRIFGLDPRGHHLTGLVIHGATVLLLFALLISLTGSPPRAFAAALLFGLHPLRVESVAWAAERKDLLAGLWLVLTMGAWLRWLRRPSTPRYGIALAAFALGLAAKPTLVTLPAVLLLLDGWPLGRIARRADLGPRMVEKIPFFVLAAASSAVTFVAQKAGGMVKPLAAVPMADRLANIPMAYLGYLKKTFWPAGLYLPVSYPAGGESGVAVAGAVLALIAVTALFLAARRLPWLSVGWFWFLGMLVPMIGLVQVAEQAMADRYTYLPAVGLCVALVWTVGEWAGRRALTAVALVSAALLLAGVTRAQVGFWRDDLTLFGHAVAVAPRDYMALTNYGGALYNAGRPDEALPHLREALRLRPLYPDALFNEGLALLQRGDASGALESMRAPRFGHHPG